jgi:hypothetical protein
LTANHKGKYAYSQKCPSMLHVNLSLLRDFINLHKAGWKTARHFPVVTQFQNQMRAGKILRFAQNDTLESS